MCKDGVLTFIRDSNGKLKIYLDGVLMNDPPKAVFVASSTLADGRIEPVHFADEEGNWYKDAEMEMPVDKAWWVNAKNIDGTWLTKGRYSSWISTNDMCPFDNHCNYDSRNGWEYSSAFPLIRDKNDFLSYPLTLVETTGYIANLGNMAVRHYIVPHWEDADGNWVHGENGIGWTDFTFTLGEDSYDSDGTTFEFIDGEWHYGSVRLLDMVDEEQLEYFEDDYV